MKRIKRIFVIFVFLALAFCYLFVKLYKLPTTPSEEETIVEETKQEEKTPWELNKEINEDYVGDIAFESNLINMPFVCPNKGVEEYTIYTYPGNIVRDYSSECEGGACTGNDVYMRTDWQSREYHAGGSIFMDYRNSLDDQNIILYGHNYITELDPNREFFFTPLEFLLEEEYYQENKYINIVLKDEVRRYEVAYVYIFDPNSSDYEDLQYYRTNYEYDFYGDEDEDYYQAYIDNMEEAKLYDTSVKLTVNDRTLTLQTCVEGTDCVEIVVAKDITNN